MYIWVILVCVGVSRDLDRSVDSVLFNISGRLLMIQHELPRPYLENQEVRGQTNRPYLENQEVRGQTNRPYLDNQEVRGQTVIDLT